MKKYTKTDYLQNIQITHHTVESTDKIVFSLCKLFSVLKLNSNWHSETLLISLIVQNSSIKNYLCHFYLEGKRQDHRVVLAHIYSE